MEQTQNRNSVNTKHGLFVGHLLTTGELRARLVLCVNSIEEIRSVTKELSEEWVQSMSNIVDPSRLQAVVIFNLTIPENLNESLLATQAEIGFSTVEQIPFNN